MPRRKRPPTPTFVPWSDSARITLRHHEHDTKIGHIAPVVRDGISEWRLAWEFDYLPSACYEDAQAAVVAACDAYPAYLQAEHEANRESYEEHEYQERFARRQAGALARAVRIPTGGQRGWKPPPGSGSA